MYWLDFGWLLVFREPCHDVVSSFLDFAFPLFFFFFNFFENYYMKNIFSK